MSISIPTKIIVEELDLVVIKWVDAYDALGSGWFDLNESTTSKMHKCRF